MKPKGGGPLFGPIEARWPICCEPAPTLDTLAKRNQERADKKIAALEKKVLELDSVVQHQQKIINKLKGNMDV